MGDSDFPLDAAAMPTVAQYQRKPLQYGNFSVEGYFATVRLHLSPATKIQVRIVPFASRGLWRRLGNIVYCGLRRSGLHHVTGDIHYATFVLPRMRTVLTILDCAFETDPNRIRQQLRRMLWYSLPVRRCAVVTVISEFTRSRLLAHLNCDPEKIRVVPVCISPLFKQCSRPFNYAKPRILQIGTTENKNLQRLGVALNGLPCHLRIIGRLTETQLNVLSREQIDFSNSCNLPESEVIKEYEECDMVVLPSTYEGFGMPIVEANVVGRPVITSNVTAMPEIAADAACLVNPFDPISIREGIERVIGDARYREQLINNGYRNALRFSAANVAKLYQQVYAELDAISCHSGAHGEQFRIHARDVP